MCLYLTLFLHEDLMSELLFPGKGTTDCPLCWSCGDSPQASASSHGLSYAALYASAYFTKWLQTISGNQPINSDCIPRALLGPAPALSLSLTLTHSSYTFWCWVSPFIIYHAVLDFFVVTSLNYENVFGNKYHLCFWVCEQSLLFFLSWTIWWFLKLPML